MARALPDGVKLRHEGEGIHRILVDGEDVGWVVSTYDGWTARLRSDHRWAWATPRGKRDQAVAGLVEHVRRAAPPANGPEVAEDLADPRWAGLVQEHNDRALGPGHDEPEEHS